MSERVAGKMARVVDELSRVVFGPAGYRKESATHVAQDALMKDYLRTSARTID